MSERETGGWGSEVSRVMDELRRGGIVSVIVAAGVFLTLYLSNAVSGAVAMLGFMLIGGAAILQSLQAGAVLHDAEEAEAGGRESAPLAATPPEALNSVVALAILEKLPDPLMLLDGAGRLLLQNRAAADLVGVTALGKHISAVIRNPSVLEAVMQVLGDQRARRVDYVAPVPIERHFEVYLAPLDVERGEGGGENGSRRPSLLLFLHDLTAVKRAEQMRADFVANASHELKTPLAAMSGFIETLRGHAKDDPEARERFLGIMHEQTERMGRLIRDLLSLSRIELNEHVPPSGTVALGGVIEDVMDTLSLVAKDHGVTVEKRVAPHLPPVIGDRDELVQVTQNLLNNAIRYGGSGGKVEVRAYETESGGRRRVALAVRDFGRGIAREHIPRLTERFYRVDVSASRESGGTGLGLAIVKHIVNRHQGRLQIESEVGQGSTFTVLLPPAASAELPPPKRKAADRAS